MIIFVLHFSNLHQLIPHDYSICKRSKCKIVEQHAQFTFERHNHSAQSCYMVILSLNVKDGCFHVNLQASSSFSIKSFLDCIPKQGFNCQNKLFRTHFDFLWLVQLFIKIHKRYSRFYKKGLNQELHRVLVIIAIIFGYDSV